MSASPVTSTDPTKPREQAGTVALSMGTLACALFGLLWTLPPIVILSPPLAIGAIVSGVSGLGRVQRDEAIGARNARLGIALATLAIAAFVTLLCWVSSMLGRDIP